LSHPVRPGAEERIRRVPPKETQKVTHWHHERHQDYFSLEEPRTRLRRQPEWHRAESSSGTTGLLGRMLPDSRVVGPGSLILSSSLLCRWASRAAIWPAHAARMAIPGRQLSCTEESSLAVLLPRACF